MRGVHNARPYENIASAIRALKSTPAPVGEDVVERAAKVIREAEFSEGQCDQCTSFKSYIPAARALASANLLRKE